jgi:serine/threonine protein kinase
MSTQDRLSELLLIWEERNEDGCPISPEDLCSDSPELLAELKKRIAALRSMDALLEEGGAGPAQANQPTTAESAAPSTPTRFDEDFEPPNYQILDEVGRGGMGVVYKARQLSLNRLVAIKTFLPGESIRPEDLGRFKLEAEAVARLQHPNIIQIYEVGEYNRRPYLALEFLDGGSLEGKMSDGRPWRPDDAAELVEMLARATHYAHQRAIIHRDLKPSNILFGSPVGAAPGVESVFGIPKIVDFGLARCLQSAGPRLTKKGTVLGTPSYMAPEQAAGRSDAIGPATDIHALGAILYELLTGNPPFDAPSVYETLKQVIRQPPTPPRALRSSTPPELEQICLKCLEKEPANRYASAEALADDLRRFRDKQPLTNRSRRPSAQSPERRRFIGAILALAILIAAIAYARHVFSPDGEKTSTENNSNGENERPKPITDADIRAKAAELRPVLIKQFVKARTPDGWILRRFGAEPNPDDEEIWAHSQALADIFLAPDLPNEQLGVWVPGLEKPFLPNQPVEVNGVKYGWRAFPGADYTVAPPALQTGLALAAALGRPGFLKGKTREECLKHLRYTQETLALYHMEPFNGGWNMFPNQKDPKQHSASVTGMALQFLLELRHAGLPWEGSDKKRDELLAATVAWVDRRFDAKANPPGWREGNDFQNITDDGLTLMFYALRLQVEMEVGTEMPAEMMEKMPLHLARCAEREAYDSTAPIVLLYPFKDFKGEETKQQQQIITTHWYRWAVAGAVLWLRHAEKRLAPTATVQSVQRALGHLVVEIGPEVVQNSLSGYVFIAGANLNGLSYVPLPADQPK